MHEGDLVAKCYYAKKKIVWEVLDGALKSKIEVQWSDIEAIRATIVDDQPGILEIEVKDLNLYLTNNLYLFFWRLNEEDTIWLEIQLGEFCAVKPTTPVLPGDGSAAAEAYALASGIRLHWRPSSHFQVQKHFHFVSISDLKT